MEKENESTATEATHDTPAADSHPSGRSAPELDSEEKRLPIADGGFGPLDSDDIEWLIENGRVWLP